MIGDLYWTHDRVYVQVNKEGTLERCEIFKLSFFRKLQLHLKCFFGKPSIAEIKAFIGDYSK